MNTGDEPLPPDRAVIHVGIGADVTDEQLETLYESISELAFADQLDVGVWAHMRGDCADDDHCWGPGSNQRREVQTQALRDAADSLSPGNGHALTVGAHSKSHVASTAVKWLRDRAVTIERGAV